MCDPLDNTGTYPAGSHHAAVYIKKRFFTINIRQFDASLIRKLLSASLPAVLQQCIPSISSCVIVACVSRFGITVIAGYGIASKLEMRLHYPAMVLNMVLTLVVGYCIGMGRLDRANDYTRVGIVISIYFGNATSTLAS